MSRLSIRGAQSPVLPVLPINNAGLDVIRVKKVYDWVVASTTEQVTSPIPSTCLPQILNVCSIDIVCCPVPASSEHIKVTSIRRNLPGLPAGTALVTVVCTLLTRLGISGKKSPCSETNCPICCIETTIPFVLKNVLVCLPEGLDEKNFSCELLCCEAFGYVFDNELEVDISVGLGITVEAEVKLEVNGKFGQPRNPIPVPPPQICLPEAFFPPQCPRLYPIPNCSCQGAVAARTLNTTLTETGLGTETGNASINVALCQECNPVGSFVNYVFSPNVNQGGFAIAFETTFPMAGNPMLSCTAIAGGTMLTLSTTGTLTRDGLVTTNVPFTLTVVRAATCTYQLVINPAGTAPGIPVISTDIVPFSCDQVVIRGCTTLPDLTPSLR